MRNGDLSDLLGVNKLYSGARVAFDPDSNQPFPNNIIPSNRISHNGQALLKAYPLPTSGFQQGTANWIGAFPHYSNLRKDTIKVDYLLSSKHRFSVRGTAVPLDF
jgi:hypothetical protein